MKRLNLSALDLALILQERAHQPTNDDQETTSGDLKHSSSSVTQVANDLLGDPSNDNAELYVNPRHIDCQVSYMRPHPDTRFRIFLKNENPSSHQVKHLTVSLELKSNSHTRSFELLRLIDLDDFPPQDRSEPAHIIERELTEKFIKHCKITVQAGLCIYVEHRHRRYGYSEMAKLNEDEAAHWFTDNWPAYPA